MNGYRSVSISACRIRVTFGAYQTLPRLARNLPCSLSHPQAVTLDMLCFHLGHCSLARFECVAPIEVKRARSSPRGAVQASPDPAEPLRPEGVQSVTYCKEHFSRCAHCTWSSHPVSGRSAQDYIPYTSEVRKGFLSSASGTDLRRTFPFLARSMC